MIEVIKNSINLYEGDCLEKLKLIKDGSIDMILTDPPYGTTACKWDTVVDLDALWVEIKRITKPNAAIVMTASQPFTTTLIASNIKNFKHEWVWQKNRGSNFATVKYQPFKEHESVLVFSRASEKVNYYPIKQERSAGGASRANYDVNASNTGKRDVYGNIKATNQGKIPKLRYPSSVQKFNTEVGLHPTQKPVALLEYLIKTYTNENETVLDFTIGSGSTCIAAMNTKRNCIGIELDNNYFNVSTKRIEDHNETLDNKYTITKHEKE